MQAPDESGRAVGVPLVDSQQPSWQKSPAAAAAPADSLSQQQKKEALNFIQPLCCEICFSEKMEGEGFQSEWSSEG